MQRTLRARVIGCVGVLALTVGLVGALGGVAAADSASDTRATFHGGNATTCSDVALGDDTQVGSGDNPANGATNSDANVSGTVAANAGAIQPGQGQEVNVTILGSNVVIDAVVVKGGNGYNVYSDSSVLPPAAQPPQHYIAPLNGGGNVPNISHWFLCYHTVEGPTTGNLAVHKDVTPPVDSTAVVPTSFTVNVSCDSGDHQLTLVAGQTQTITGLPVDDVCTVVEDQSAFPPLSAVTYTPTTAPTDGVTIGDGTTVTVNILNDFGAVLGTSVVTPPATPAVAPATAVAATPAFTG